MATDPWLQRTGIVLLILAGPLVDSLLAQAVPQDRELNYSLGAGLRWLEPSRGNPLVGPELWPNPAANVSPRHSFASATSTTAPKPPKSPSQPKMAKPPWAEEFSEPPSSPTRANPAEEGRSTGGSPFGAPRRSREGAFANEAILTNGKNLGGASVPRKESIIFLSPRQEPVLPKKTPTNEGESDVIANPRRPLGW